MRKFEPVIVKPARKRGKIAPTQMAHIVLMTTRANYETMVRWYEIVLESEVSYANDDIAFLCYDDEHHRIAIGILPGSDEMEVPPPSPFGFNHLAFTYESFSDLATTYKRLKAEGVVPYWCINHGPTMSMYFKDPDGNRMELFSDNFHSAEEMQKYFDDGHFEANFMGIMFDPDEVVAKFESGVPLEEVIKRPPLPEGMSPWDQLIP